MTIDDVLGAGGAKGRLARWALAGALGAWGLAAGGALASAQATVGASPPSRLNVASCAPNQAGHEPSRLTTTCANDQRRSAYFVVAKGSAPTARRTTVKWFESPSGNISCEIDDQRPGIPDQAYCQTFTPAQSATLRPGGSVRICKGTGCVGNPPDDDRPLPYGSAISLGPFRCTSGRDGVTCTIGAGTGFRISRAGIARVRPR